LPQPSRVYHASLLVTSYTSHTTDFHLSAPKTRFVDRSNEGRVYTHDQFVGPFVVGDAVASPTRFAGSVFERAAVRALEKEGRWLSLSDSQERLEVRGRTYCSSAFETIARHDYL
jgi:hypothetical protein